MINNISLYRKLITASKKSIVIGSYALLTSLLLLIICLLFYKFSFAGYFTDRIIFWLWTIETLYIIINYFNKKIIKFYIGFLISGILLSIIPMGIPFAAIILSTTGIGLQFKEQINDKYRFQITGYSIISKPDIEIIENKWIFEKDKVRTKDYPQINDSTSIGFYDFKKVKFISENDSIITLEIFGKGHRVIQNFKKNKFN
jgi:hypothetical protein